MSLNLLQVQTWHKSWLAKCASRSRMHFFVMYEQKMFFPLRSGGQIARKCHSKCEPESWGNFQAEKNSIVYFLHNSRVMIYGFCLENQKLSHHVSSQPSHKPLPVSLLSAAEVCITVMTRASSASFRPLHISTEIGWSLFPRLRDSPLGAGDESHNLGKVF